MIKLVSIRPDPKFKRHYSWFVQTNVLKEMKLSNNGVHFDRGQLQPSKKHVTEKFSFEAILPGSN